MESSFTFRNTGSSLDYFGPGFFFFWRRGGVQPLTHRVIFGGGNRKSMQWMQAFSWLLEEGQDLNIMNISYSEQTICSEQKWVEKWVLRSYCWLTTGFTKIRTCCIFKANFFSRSEETVTETEKSFISKLKITGSFTLWYNLSSMLHLHDCQWLLPL